MFSNDNFESLIPKLRKSYKIPHVGPNTWRQIYLHIANEVIEEQDKFIHERRSTVTPLLASTGMRIYNGKTYTKIMFTPYSVGFKFGEFTWNRKMALYKAKQLRKKKNKKKNKKK